MKTAPSDDRAWFAAHRAAALRLRQALPGEIPAGWPSRRWPVGDDALVLVGQLASGAIERRLVLGCGIDVRQHTPADVLALHWQSGSLRIPPRRRGPQ